MCYNALIEHVRSMRAFIEECGYLERNAIKQNTDVIFFSAAVFHCSRWLLLVIN